ncbi:MAG: hypothetical protein H0U85_06180 [Gemmatimonadales bacterium]|nr:hypothetical protein [Gemmatimonadales bacterium]
MAEYVADDKDKTRTKELAQALLKKEETNGVAQTLVTRGRARGTQAEGAKVTELEADLQRAKDEMAEMKQENAELRSKEPNWQRRIEEVERKTAEKIKAAEERANVERAARMADRIDTARQRFISAVSPNVRESYRREVLPVGFADRFVAGDDGTVKVLELGKTTPYDPEDGDPAEQLAHAVLEKVHPDFRLMGVPDAGAGTPANGTVDKAIAQIADQKARTGMYQL